MSRPNSALACTLGLGTVHTNQCLSGTAIPASASIVLTVAFCPCSSCALVDFRMNTTSNRFGLDIIAALCDPREKGAADRAGSRLLGPGRVMTPSRCRPNGQFYCRRLLL